MSTIKDRENEAVQDIMEQNVIEDKLAKARKAKKAKAALAAEKPTVEKKKGQKVTFVPASRLPKLTAPEGFKVAWKHNTPENVRRLQYEGWDIANRIEHNMDVEMGSYYKKINDKPTTEKESTITHNELIAMLIPEDMAVARREYYREETEKQTRAKLMPEKNASAFMQDKAKLNSTIEIN